MSNKDKTVRIDPDLLNGLKIKAMGEKRPVANMLRVILEREGIQRYTDEEFKRHVKKLTAEVIAK